MATVYLADDIKHELKVALEVLKPELAAVVGADRFFAADQRYRRFSLISALGEAVHRDPQALLGYLAVRRTPAIT